MGFPNAQRILDLMISSDRTQPGGSLDLWGKLHGGSLGALIEFLGNPWEKPWESQGNGGLPWFIINSVS